MALRHFAYFPGTVVTAAVWRVLPARSTTTASSSSLRRLAFSRRALFPAPLAVRLAAGAALAASPLAGARSVVRYRRRAEAPARARPLLRAAHPLPLPRSRGGGIAVALLLKQFALVALPFFAVMLLARRPDRRTLEPRGRRLRRDRARGVPALPRRRPGGALARHGQLRRRHLPHPRLRSGRDPGRARRHRGERTRTPSPSSRCSSGSRSRPGSCGTRSAPVRSGWPRPASRSRSSCSSTSAESCRTPIWSGRWPAQPYAALLAAGARADRTLRLDDDDRGGGRRADVPGQV